MLSLMPSRRLKEILQNVHVSPCKMKMVNYISNFFSNLPLPLSVASRTDFKKEGITLSTFYKGILVFTPTFLKGDGGGLLLFENNSQ
jgi:hypothetical protein